MTTSLRRHGDFFGLLDNYLGTSWDYLRTNFKYLGIYRELLWHRQIPQPYSLGTCGSHCTSILRWSGVRWTEEQRTPCLNQQRPSQQCLEYRRLEGRRPRKERNILSLQLQPWDHSMRDLIQQAQLNTHDCSTILKRILFYPLYYDTILIFELKTIVSIFTSVSFLSSFAASDLEQRPAEDLSASSTFSLSSSPWTKEIEGRICEKHFAADLTNLSAWFGLRRHFERRQVEAEIGFRKKEMFRLWNLEMLLLKAVRVDHRSALLTVPTVEHLVRLYKSSIRTNWKMSWIGQVP